MISPIFSPSSRFPAGTETSKMSASSPYNRFRYSCIERPDDPSLPWTAGSTHLPKIMK